MVIEIETFRLADGADEEAFLDADELVHQEFANLEPGFIRRTTARGDDGAWIVITLWTSSDAADKSAQRAEGVAAGRAFRRLLDQASLEVARYETLD